MATKFHISENGMPGKCNAASPDSCPKTQAGDGFHGTLEEATQESQKRFEAQLGAFVTSTRADEAQIAQESGAEVYVHPQGKVVRVEADGTVRAFKDGVEVSTSATAEKLRSGYGSWRLDSEASVPSRPAKLSAAEEKSRVNSYLSKVEAAAKATHALAEVGRIEAYHNSAFALSEGRAYYTVNNGGKVEKVHGINPRGLTRFEPSEEQLKARQAALELAKAARAELEEAQTELEEAGLGHRIADEGHTIRVRTQAQKWLLQDELQGQISDGHWENSSNNPWQDWTNAKVVVDPQNPGRNFSTRKDNYQLNSKELLDVVGGRMVENVQTRTKNSDYNEKAMQADLKDLRTIFKTQRSQVTGD